MSGTPPLTPAEEAEVRRRHDAAVGVLRQPSSARDDVGRLLATLDATRSEPAGLRAALAAFAGLLEAEWYNGNMTEAAYLRLNGDLTGIVAKRLAAALASKVSEP